MKKTETAAEVGETEMPEKTEILEEYDFRGGRRGVYAERYAQKTNLVALVPHLMEVFPETAV